MSSAPFQHTKGLALGEIPGRKQLPRVVVTGGSGRLGRSTCQYLSDNGWEVINFDTRRPATAAEDGKAGINVSGRCSFAGPDSEDS